MHTEPDIPTHPHVDEDPIVGLLKAECHRLLQQLQAFRIIEEEYKKKARALAILSGEATPAGRPAGGGNNGVPSRRPRSASRALYLSTLAEAGPEGMSVADLHDSVQIGDRPAVSTMLSRMAAVGRVTRVGPGRWAMTQAGLDWNNSNPESEEDGEDGGEEEHHHGKRTSSGRTDKMSQMEILRWMVEHPDGGGVTEIVESVNGTDQLKRRLSVALPTMCNNKLLHREPKEGLRVRYTITKQGRTRLAELMER